MGNKGLKLTQKGIIVSKSKNVNLFYEGYNHFVNGRIKYNFDYKNVIVKL